ncbi:hypothetical protein FD754_025431, partial [Muntiacus muntjak]
PISMFEHRGVDQGVYFGGRVDIPGCHSGGLWPGFHGFCTSLSHSWEEMRLGLYSQSWAFVNITSDPDQVPYDKWEKLISQDSHLEIFGHVSSMTLDTIMKCAFSHQGRVQMDRNSQSYIQAIKDLSHLLISRVRNVFHQNDFMYRLTPEGRWNHQACQLAHQHTDAVIKERKSHLQKEGELEKVRSRRHLDFLDILLFARMENGSSLSDEDLRAEVDTFMFEGHDTTASGISWILYALASHPEHQQRCREEIQSLLGESLVVQSCL